MNLEWSDMAKLRIEKMNEMGEFHFYAYDSSGLYKEIIKLYYERKIEHREFHLRDLVWLNNLRLHLFP